MCCPWNAAIIFVKCSQYLWDKVADWEFLQQVHAVIIGANAAVYSPRPGVSFSKHALALINQCVITTMIKTYGFWYYYKKWLIVLLLEQLAPAVCLTFMNFYRVMFAITGKQDGSSCMRRCWFIARKKMWYLVLKSCSAFS